MHFLFGSAIVFGASTVLGALNYDFTPIKGEVCGCESQHGVDFLECLMKAEDCGTFKFLNTVSYNETSDVCVNTDKSLVGLQWTTDGYGKFFTIFQSSRHIVGASAAISEDFKSDCKLDQLQYSEKIYNSTCQFAEDGTVVAGGLTPALTTEKGRLSIYIDDYQNITLPDTAYLQLAFTGTCKLAAVNDTNIAEFTMTNQFEYPSGASAMIAAGVATAALITLV